MTTPAKLAAVVAAIRTFTIEAPDNRPNGRAERAILDLEHVLDPNTRCDNPESRLDGVRAAAAELCAALAHDVRALRLAAEGYFCGDFRTPGPDGDDPLSPEAIANRLTDDRALLSTIVGSGLSCRCGGIILADTEDWTIPLCPTCWMALGEPQKEPRWPLLLRMVERNVTHSRGLPGLARTLCGRDGPVPEPCGEVTCELCVDILGDVTELAGRLGFEDADGGRVTTVRRLRKLLDGVVVVVGFGFNRWTVWIRAGGAPIALAGTPRTLREDAETDRRSLINGLALALTEDS